MIEREPTENFYYWQESAHLLNRWGIRAFVASLLESLGPLTLIGAQLAYIGQPMLSGFINPDKYQAMVGLLEDSEQMKAFVTYLQEEEEP